MKRRVKREKQKEKIKSNMRKIILFVLFSILLFCTLGFYKEQKVKFLEENEIVAERTEAVEEIKKETAPIVKESIEESYLGFEAIAKLEVPKIGLNTYILKDYTQKGMKVCASKFWGPEPNEVGNFCIAGHNYPQENMFNHLIDLQIGDELYLTDNKNGKYAYTIDKIYKVKPENTAPIHQETLEKRMVTLITCVNYSKNRLIVQAVEK